jgi:hypothetical protein
MSGLVKKTQASLTEVEKRELVISKLTKRELAVLNSLDQFNQLRSFKLDFWDCIKWKDTILRLMPEVETKAIEFVIDQLILGNLEYDKDRGIQNIIEGLRRLEKTGNGYKLNTMTW